MPAAACTTGSGDSSVAATVVVSSVEAGVTEDWKSAAATDADGTSGTTGACGAGRGVAIWLCVGPGIIAATAMRGVAGEAVVGSRGGRASSAKVWGRRRGHDDISSGQWGRDDAGRRARLGQKRGVGSR